nr:CUAEP/CCAEP-tail radical SAM protein [Kallotenue papyrolyticum]
MVLISTYELGHQPFGLASPAAWLREAGAEVVCCDLAVTALDHAAVAQAGLIALYVPMHTATRLVTRLLPELRRRNPAAHLCCFGLYAPVNEGLLRTLGAQTILGGEFEEGLVALYRRLADGNVATGAAQPEPRISLARQEFRVPERQGLPPLQRYAALQIGTQRRTVGYTEASRGCKHRCRHCPIVPVYNGRFRIINREVVLADIRQQVAAGAQHISFGDPDFFNGPGHAIPLVQALHAEFPELTYDVTIKIEHLLRHAALLPILRATGCVLITSAVEAVDEAILARFDKRHTPADFRRAVALTREVGIALNPTFVAFTPWTTRAGYRTLLHTIAELDLIDNVAPVQYAIRLLIPAGSRLLELPEVQSLIGPFDPAALCYPWHHPDPAMDALQQRLMALIERAQRQGASRRDIFAQVWHLAHALDGLHAGLPQPARAAEPRKPIPFLTEPWYC